MVVGYACPECGFKHECGVASDGQRICPECSIAVTGITTKDMGRRPDGGSQTYVITTGWAPKNTLRVNAYDYESAYEAARSELAEDACITDITLEENYPTL